MDRWWGNGRRTTLSEHQALIRQQYGCRDFTDEAALFSTVRWLYTRAWLHDEPPSRLFDLLVLWLKERKVLLPGITTLEELINHIRDQAARRIWARLDKQLTEAQRQTLQTLVTTENREQTTLDRLRDGPTVISSNALQVALERIKELRQVRLGSLDVSWLAPDRLKKLARYAGLSKADTINRLDVPRKWATLAAFVYAYETRAIDDALDLFDSLVQTRLTRAGNQGEKKRIRTLRDLDAAARHLGQAGTLLLTLDPTQPVILNDVLFHIIPREQLVTAVFQVDALTRPPDDNYYELLRNHYNQFRRFLPAFWYTLTFAGLESVAPRDLALGWGDMSDPSVDEWIHWRQSGRWYHYDWNNGAFSQSYITGHSANVHIIPATDNLDKALRQVENNDLVYLEGYLVNLQVRDGARVGHVNTSLSREDTGAGAIGGERPFV